MSHIKLFNYTELLLSCLKTGVLFFVCLFTTAVLHAESNPLIKIGVHDNKPITFKDEKGQYQGLAIDIINAAFADRDIQIQYVDRPWIDMQLLLDEGQIDLFAGLEFTDAWAQYFEFNQQAIINNWAVIYQPQTSTIQSLQDLEGKRIALVTNDLHSRVFDRLMTRFGFNFLPIDVDSLTAVFLALDNNEADAGVVNRIFGVLESGKYDVEPTSVIFNPVAVKFAAPPGQSQQWLTRIDDVLEKSKADKNSFYYQSQGRWLHDSHAAYVNPKLKIVIFSVIAAFIITLVINYFLRREVKRRIQIYQRSEARLKKQQDALQILSKLQNADLSTLDLALNAATEIAANTLMIERASIWLYNKNKSELECRDLYELGKRKHSQGDRLYLNQGMEFFAELDEGRIIVVDDAENNLITHDLLDSYLRPNQIGSLICAPIRSAGLIVGLFSIEQHETRQWAVDEENFAGSIADAVSLSIELWKHKSARTELMLSNRGLHALSACNEALVRATEEQQLLNEICQIIIDIAGYKMAWVGYLNNDEEKTVRPVAHAGFDDDYLERIKISWADNIYGQGPTGKAIRTSEISVANNILEDPQFAPWREAAIERGYASSVALPLMSANQVIGALNIYAKEKDAFNDSALRLLKDLASDLSFGLTAFYAEKDRAALELQLQQAQKMETVGQLTGGIAHDFNNILASILGYTGLALDRFVDKEAGKLREYLEEVYRAGERARDLITQMLAFSRATPSLAQSLDVRTVIRELNKILQTTLPSNIRFKSILSKHLPNVLMDPVQLHQMLMNLSLNARDAIIGNGEIIIETALIHIDGLECSSCHEKIPVGDYVDITVSDTGEGLNQGVIDHIFEPFFTTKEIGKGTGMGLAMVHGLSHDNKGHIRVEPGKTEGTRFRLLFPSQHEAQQERKEDESLQAEVESGVTGHHILVVDDEESIAGFLSDLFESNGYQVTTYSDSADALKYFQTHADQVDLVFTDQTMPNLTGLELAQNILEIDADMPIILSTGYSETVNEEIALAEGLRGFLMKPMLPKDILELVTKLLETRK